jgi:hypothetical protein
MRAPPNTPGKVGVRLDRLLKLIHEYLLLEDDDVFLIVLGTVAAFLRGLDPVWLLIVAPPSGAKTDFIEMLDEVEEIFPLSDLTSNTLASGFGTADTEDVSLLHEVEGKILALKDLTTVLQMRRDQRGEVLAQLREIYDGRFNKAWGTGRRLRWTGRIGFIAGVTAVIDRHHEVMGTLGQRFVLTRPRQPDRKAAARRAIENTKASSRKGIRQTIAKEVAHFFETLPAVVPELPRSQVDQLTEIADLVTRARSPVFRDGHTREIDDAPAPEMPARFARQLAALVRGIAIVRGHETVVEDDMRLVGRVGADCLPPSRRAVLRALTRATSPLPIDQVMTGKSALSETTIRRSLEDLHALGLLNRQGEGQGTTSRWSLKQSQRRGAQLCFRASRRAKGTSSQRVSMRTATAQLARGTGDG